jgi:PAS domain S-box-containing protein
MSGLEGSARHWGERETALHAQALRQRELLDSVEDGVFLCDAATGDIVDCNAGACELFGYEAADLTRLSITALSANEQGYNRERLEQWLHDALRHGKVRFEWRSRRRNGVAFWSEVRVTRSSLAGEPRVLVVVRDVSLLRASSDSLRLAEARYRLLVRNLPNSAIILCDRDMRFVLVDGPEITATGFSKEVMEGHTIYEALPPDFVKLVEGNIRRVLGGEVFSAELPFGDRFYLYHYLPIRDDAGDIVYALILASNVTEQRRAEAAHKKSEEKFTRIFELSPDVMAVTRADDGTIMELNPRFEAMFGWTRPEALHKTTVELGLWPELDDRRAVVHAFERDGKVDNREMRLRRKNGSELDGMVSIRPIELDGQACMLATFRDISEQARAQQALAASEDRFRVLSEATFEGLGFTEQGRIVDINDQFASMFGCQREQLIGTHVASYVAPESQATVAERMKAGNTEPYEHMAIRGDGSVFPVEVRARLVQIGGKTMRVSAVRDITKQKEAVAEREHLIAELSAKNAEMEQFTHTVSHDLKSPLVTINGFLGLLERDLEDGDLKRVHGDIARIGSAARKMMRLLDDLVDLSRVGRVANTAVEVSLGDIVGDALELVSGPLAERGVKVDVAPQFPVVFCDKIRLVQVVQNLLENAVKYMGTRSDPRVEIGVRPDPDYDVCFVRDNGIGVDPRYAERIFNLFEKLDPRSEGTGVGLALAKRIVEFHRGSIAVESDGSHGSTFVFRLPRGDAAHRARQRRGR